MVFLALLLSGGGIESGKASWVQWSPETGTPPVSDIITRKYVLFFEMSPSFYGLPSDLDVVVRQRVLAFAYKLPLPGAERSIAVSLPPIRSAQSLSRERIPLFEEPLPDRTDAWGIFPAAYSYSKESGSRTLQGIRCELGECWRRTLRQYCSLCLCCTLFQMGRKRHKKRGLHSPAFRLLWTRRGDSEWRIVSSPSPRSTRVILREEEAAWTRRVSRKPSLF